MKNFADRSRARPKTSIALSMLAFATQALANDTVNDSAASKNDSDGLSEIPEIIVTAQRKATELSKTPVAVSALSADKLTQQRVLSEADLPNVAPGLGVRATVSSNQLNYVIRGQTVDAFSNNRPGVLPYFDEVQIGGAGAASAFYDLASVQVLKGPQGTLFGRNSTGGAVLFTSQAPTNELGGYASVSYGNYNDVKVEGAINAPLVSDKVLLRLAGFYKSRDGYQFNEFTDSRIGGLDRYGFRGSLVADITDTLQNKLVVDYADLKGAGNVAVIGSVDDGIAPIPAGLLFPGLVAQLAAQRANGPFTVNIDRPDTTRSKNTLVSNITTLDAGGGNTLKNIVGYTSLETVATVDVDGSSLNIYNIGNSTAVHQFSDEPQFLGRTGIFDYVFGGYFSSERNVTYIGSNVLGQPPSASTPQCTRATQCNDAVIKNTTDAGYAQSTIDLSEVTGITGAGATAGARYTSETVSYTELPSDSYYDLVSAAGALIGASSDQQKTSRNISWTDGLQDQIDANTLLYVANRRSYRNGGYNSILLPIVGLASSGGNGYGTETATDLEVGVKFNGRADDLPATLNFAAYSTWIQNAQHALYGLSYGLVPIGGTPIPAIFAVNVPRARVQGVEVDGSLKPATWLRIGAALNYTDAKYTDGQVDVPGPKGVTSAVLSSYPDTPKWSGNISADLTVPAANQIDLIAHGDLYGQSSAYYSSEAQINTQAVLPDYVTANFHVGVQSTQGWSFVVNLKNAFNRVYYVGGLPAANLIAFNSLIPGDPRTISAQLRYQF